jgi:hypothetical protein
VGPFRVTEPSRVVGDEPRCFEIGAHLGHMPAYVGVIGERLSITFRLAGMDDLAQFVERRLRDTEVDRSVRAPEPVHVSVAEPPRVVRAKDGSILRHPSFLQNQRVAAGRAHAEHIPIG